MKRIQIGVVVFVLSLVVVVSSAIAAPKAGDTWIEPSTGMEFVYVPGGCFQMGDLFGVGHREVNPIHEVCVNDFYMGKYEATQKQWEKVTEMSIRQQRDKVDASQALYGEGEDFPVYYVSWEDAQEFTHRLTGKTSKNFRLPTEAEWEYAARSGGKKEKYAGGDNIDSVAWYADNSGNKVHPVGSKKPNSLGLYDMSGNILEWTQDWYEDDYYGRSPRLNPQGPSFSLRKTRSHRGGSWFRKASNASSIYRGCSSPDKARAEMGFRVLLPAGEVQ